MLWRKDGHVLIRALNIKVEGERKNRGQNGMEKAVCRRTRESWDNARYDQSALLTIV